MFSSSLTMMRNTGSREFLHASIPLSAFMINNRKWTEFYTDISQHVRWVWEIESIDC